MTQSRKIRFCSVGLLVVTLSACATPSGSRDERAPAANREAFNCGAYEDPQDRRACAIIARQSIEAIGFYTRYRVLTARMPEAMRVKVRRPAPHLGAGAITAIVGAFVGGGSSSASGSAMLSRRPGAFANRLLEAIAVTSIGVKGTGLGVSSIGGGSALTAMSFAAPTVENPTSSQAASTNLMLVFRKSRVDAAVAEANAAHRAAAEAAFTAEIATIAATIVNEKLQPLLYLDEDQTNRALALLKAEIEKSFRTREGRIDETLDAKVDLLAVLRSLGKETAAKLKALDTLLRDLEENAQIDPKQISETIRGMPYGYRFLVQEFEELARTANEKRETEIATALKGFAETGEDARRLRELDADLARFAVDVTAFAKRLEVTRKLLKD